MKIRKLNKGLIYIVVSIVIMTLCLFLIKEIMDYKFEVRKNSFSMENISTSLDIRN